MREVGVEEARRIAVRAQLLDGTATDVLSTVRHLGFLQLDPISVVAPPQHLVLWSRLGDGYDPTELDRLLWEDRKLVEWDAFLYPIEDLPILKARMRRREGLGSAGSMRSSRRTPPTAAMCCASSSGAGRSSHARSRITRRRSARRTAGGAREDGADARRAQRARSGRRRRPARQATRLGPRRPLVSRNRDDPVGGGGAPTRGEAVPLAGRAARQGQMDRASRRRRQPCACSAHDVPLALRPARPRPRTRAQALGLLLQARDVRAEGEARVRLLRPPHPERRPSPRPHRAGAQPQDGHARVLGTGGKTSRSATNRSLRSLARWLGASLE